MSRGYFCIVTLSVLVAVALGPLVAGAQVLTYSQPQETPILLNPSLAGSGSQMRLSLLLRNQWLNIKSPYNTYGVTYDMHFGTFDNHAVGISAVNDVQGNHVIQHTEMQLYYAYMWDVTYRFRLRLGVSGGATMKTTRYDGLIFPDMLGAEAGEYQEPSYGTSLRFAPDFAVGVSGEVDDWHFGAAAHHLAEPSFDVRSAKYLSVKRRYTVHARKEWNIFGQYRFKTPLYVVPHLIASYQGDLLLLAAGCEVKYLGIKASLWLRESILHMGHNACASFGWEGDRLSVYYSYNMGFLPNGFHGLNASVHELGVTVKFPYGGMGGIKSPFGTKRKTSYTRYSRKRAAVSRVRRSPRR